jgi:hypothetical protein
MPIAFKSKQVQNCGVKNTKILKWLVAGVAVLIVGGLGGILATSTSTPPKQVALVQRADASVTTTTVDPTTTTVPAPVTVTTIPAPVTVTQDTTPSVPVQQQQDTATTVPTLPTCTSQQITDAVNGTFGAAASYPGAEVQGSVDGPTCIIS